MCVGVFRLIAIKRIWMWFGPMALYCIKTSCGHVCGGLRECVWVFQALLGVCGGFPLDRNQADLAVVWSYGIVLHQNIIWACLWRSSGVCVGVLSTFGNVWEFSA